MMLLLYIPPQRKCVSTLAYVVKYKCKKNTKDKNKHLSKWKNTSDQHCCQWSVLYTRLC